MVVPTVGITREGLERAVAHSGPSHCEQDDGTGHTPWNGCVRPPEPTPAGAGSRESTAGAARLCRRAPGGREAGSGPPTRPAASRKPAEEHAADRPRGTATSQGPLEAHGSSPRIEPTARRRPHTPHRASAPSWRSASPIPTAPGSAEPRRAPTACSARTFPSAPTSRGTAAAASIPSPSPPASAHAEDYDSTKARRSGLRISGRIESMPCGSPSYDFRVPLFGSSTDRGTESA